jgi:DUF1365 family protein
MTLQSAIYTGILQHTRSKPKPHDFHYQVAMFYLDLSEIKKIFCVPFLFSDSSPRLIGFNRKDYLKGPGSITEAVAKLILEKTGKAFQGKVRLLTQIRYFGFCFNPVSFYYCFDENESLRFIVSDITNTPWNEKHAYVSEVDPENAEHRFEFKKEFHVSPFFPMDLLYVWRFNTPNPNDARAKLLVHMEDWNFEKTDRVFEAHLALKAKPLTAKNVILLLLSFPLLTFKTFIAIYYQALRLKLKGAHFYSHPTLEKNHEK